MYPDLYLPPDPLPAPSLVRHGAPGTAGDPMVETLRKAWRRCAGLMFHRGDRPRAVTPETAATVPGPACSAPAADAAPYRIHRYPSALIDRLPLAGGRVVTVRPVLPQDASAERAFIAALSPSMRRRRFFAAMRELPESLARALTEIDYRSQLAIVAETMEGADADADDAEPCIVADARYVLEPAGDCAEFAIVVADRWQGMGLGGALITRLVAQARRRGLARLHGDVFADNQSMIGLVRRHGGRISPHLADSSLVRATFLL